jgi:hypothetical protein
MCAAVDHYAFRYALRLLSPAKYPNRNQRTSDGLSCHISQKEIISRGLALYVNSAVSRSENPGVGGSIPSLPTSFYLRTSGTSGTSNSVRGQAID